MSQHDPPVVLLDSHLSLLIANFLLMLKFPLNPLLIYVHTQFSLLDTLVRYHYTLESGLNE